MADERDNLELDNETLNNKRVTINVPGDHVAEACQDVYDAKTGHLVSWGYYYALANNWTWKQAAAEFGLPSDVIKRVWRGKPNEGDLDKLLKATAKIREELGHAQPRYAMTSIAKDIINLFNVAVRFSEQGQGGLFLVAGQTGIGKTHIGKACCEGRNHGLSQFYGYDNGGGKKHVIYEIAALNNINHWMNYTDIVPRVAKCFYPGRVLWFDELDLTLERRQDPTDIVEWLRRLADLRKCSIVLAGRFNRIVRNVKRTNYDITQLRRRCKRSKIIQHEATDGDIELLVKFKFRKLGYSNELKVVLTAINRHRYGGFGGVANVLDVAKDFAEHDCGGEPLTQTHVLTVAKRELDDMKALEREIGEGGK